MWRDSSLRRGSLPEGNFAASRLDSHHILATIERAQEHAGRKDGATMIGCERSYCRGDFF
ncbi:MAG: hypothetical protein NVS4B5_15410 [Vulcanimicrobiaceae bacterium]